MSQTYDATKPASGTTTFGQLYQILRDHFEAVRSSFSGTSFSSNPIEGQRCWRTDRSMGYVYTGNPSIGESGWIEDVIANMGIGAEVAAARGTKPSVDQRLDVALNEDGTLKASTTLNPSQWYKPSLTFTYVSTTSFMVNGDQTDIYKPTRRLKINLTASTVYSEVLSASYGSPNTTVQVLDAVINNTLVDVEHSLFLPLKDNGALSPEMIGNPHLKAVTAAYTATLNDTIIHADATAGAFTVTLPTAASAGAGRKYLFKKTDTSANAVTIDGNGSETIDGALTTALAVKDSILQIYCDGTNWRVKASSSLAPYTGFPSGTKLIFPQASAPTGWTQDTSQNDKALRVVSGSGGGSGGTNGLSSANTGGHTLTSAEVPNHGHTIADPGHTHAVNNNNETPTGPPYGLIAHAAASTGSVTSAYTGVTVNNTTGGGGSHSHPLALAYVDVIVCSKN